jgi:phosphoribosyl 1,2-cyclic phosphate phosphodiesterase
MITGYVFSAPPADAGTAPPRFAYLTDCKRLPPATIEAVRGAEIVVISALWETWTHPNHMNLEEALELAESIGAKMTYLTHLTHFMGKHETINAKLPPGVQLAYDGLSLELGDNRPAV